MSMKNPLTPTGIEPATFRFVAQHLNHCATAVTTTTIIIIIIIIIIKTRMYVGALVRMYKRHVCSMEERLELTYQVQNFVPGLNHNRYGPNFLPHVEH